MPAWQSILWIFQVFFTRWCGIMASKKSFLRMTIIVPSAVASAASASSRGRRRLKGPSASSGMWSSTTTILLLYLLVLEVAAFQQNFGKIGKSQLLTRLRGHSQATMTNFWHFSDSLSPWLTVSLHKIRFIFHCAPPLLSTHSHAQIITYPCINSV